MLPPPNFLNGDQKVSVSNYGQSIVVHDVIEQLDQPIDNIKNRLHYMDLLRGILMMLGVVLHTLAIYTVNSDWKVSSPTSVSYADPILNIIHLFRMPAFFMISGYFMALILGKQDTIAYVKNRIIRLGVPLLFAGILFNLPVAMFINGGPVDIGWYQYIVSGSWLGHLWFLGALILYSTVVAFIWKWIKPVISFQSNWLWVLSLFSLMMIYPITLRIGWYMELNNIKLILITVSNIFEYFPYFLCGLILFFQSKNIKLGTNLHWWILVSVVFYLMWSLIKIKLVTDCLMFILAACLSFTLFAFFEKYFNGKARWKQDLANSSYTVYLVHQPIIIIISFYMVDSWLNIHIQVAVIMMVTALLAFIIHFKLVKKNRTLAFLMNGRLRRS
jgi:glucan biosynthesis protein C